MDDNVKTNSIARIITDEKWILIQPDFLTNSLSLKRQPQVIGTNELKKEMTDLSHGRDMKNMHLAQKPEAV